MKCDKCGYEVEIDPANKYPDDVTITGLSDFLKDKEYVVFTKSQADQYKDIIKKYYDWIGYNKFIVRGKFVYVDGYCFNCGEKYS